MRRNIQAQKREHTKNVIDCIPNHKNQISILRKKFKFRNAEMRYTRKHFSFQFNSVARKWQKLFAVLERELQIWFCKGAKKNRGGAESPEVKSDLNNRESERFVERKPCNSRGEEEHKKMEKRKRFGGIVCDCRELEKKNDGGKQKERKRRDEREWRTGEKGQPEACKQQSFASVYYSTGALFKNASYTFMGRRLCPKLAVRYKALRIQHNDI